MGKLSLATHRGSAPQWCGFLRICEPKLFPRGPCLDGVWEWAPQLPSLAALVPSSEDWVLGHWRNAGWMTSAWGITAGDVLEKELMDSGGSLSSATDPQL